MAGKEYTTHCGSCGNPREERTPGCTQCNNRHAKWKAKGDIRYKAPAKRACVKCGTDVSKVNPDCERCVRRKKMRKNDLNRKLRLEDEHVHEINKKYYDAWVEARRKRIARRESLDAVGRRPIV